MELRIKGQIEIKTQYSLSHSLLAFKREIFNFKSHRE